MTERGLHVHASCFWRWVRVFGPELDKRSRPHLKPTNKSYLVDETYIKVKGLDRYLYRALDSTAQTIDFPFTPKRAAALAKQFFRKVFANPANVQPCVINVDKNPTYPAAIKELKDEGALRRRCRVREWKYLTNIIEQDHRTVKRRAWLAMDYGSFRSAWRTLQSRGGQYDSEGQD